jgi:hypothetical protein
MTLCITTLCHYAGWRFAECHGLFIVMLRIVMLSVVMLSAVMLSVVMLSDIMLSVVMLSVVTPYRVKTDAPNCGVSLRS